MESSSPKRQKVDPDRSGSSSSGSKNAENGPSPKADAGKKVEQLKHGAFKAGLYKGKYVQVVMILGKHIF